jgi:hypothetical protein
MHARLSLSLIPLKITDHRFTCLRCDKEGGREICERRGTEGEGINSKHRLAASHEIRVTVAVTCGVDGGSGRGFGALATRGLNLFGAEPLSFITMSARLVVATVARRSENMVVEAGNTSGDNV